MKRCVEPRCSSLASQSSRRRNLDVSRRTARWRFSSPAVLTDSKGSLATSSPEAADRTRNMALARALEPPRPPQGPQGPQGLVRGGVRDRLVLPEGLHGPREAQRVAEVVLLGGDDLRRPHLHHEAVLRRVEHGVGARLRASQAASSKGSTALRGVVEAELGRDVCF